MVVSQLPLQSPEALWKLTASALLERPAARHAAAAAMARARVVGLILICPPASLAGPTSAPRVEPRRRCLRPDAVACAAHRNSSDTPAARSYWLPQHETCVRTSLLLGNAAGAGVSRARPRRLRARRAARSMIATGAPGARVVADVLFRG